MEEVWVGGVSRGEFFVEEGQAGNVERELLQGMTHGDAFTDRLLPPFSPRALKYEGLITQYIRRHPQNWFLEYVFQIVLTFFSTSLYRKYLFGFCVNSAGLALGG